MTKQNCTVKKRGKQSRVAVGDIFTTNEGCEVTVVDYKNAFNVVIEFDYPSGYQRVVRADHLRVGSIKNLYLPKVYGVGYMGEGEYLAKENRKNTSAYAAWHGIMQRCYDPKMQAKSPTYKGCAVHPEWHNFQVFAKWFYGQKHYMAGFEVDKDLLVDGNKVYSPDACCVVPQELNVLFNDSHAGKGSVAPTGVNYHARLDKFEARISINGERVYLGVFKCPYEAEAVYKKAKQDYVKAKIEEWKGRIEGIVINALYRKIEQLN